MRVDEVKGERVLVTGGAGFIGSHLVDALVESGARTTVVDNLLTGRRENVHPGADFREVDIRDRETLLALFREARPRLVFHLAAQSSVKVSVDDPHLDVEINLLGGVNVLDGAREADARRVLFASTGGALYGEVPEGECAGEDWPARPVSPYAASKASFEHLLASYRECYGLESSILRFANVYGPRQDPHGEAGVVAIFCGRLLAGKPVTLYARREPGDGGCVRDYVYVADVVEACLLAAAAAPGVFNVGTEVATTTDQVLMILANRIGVHPLVKNAGKRSGDLERSVLAYSTIATEGWHPRTKLQDGLNLTADWFLSRNRA